MPLPRKKRPKRLAVVDAETGERLEEYENQPRRKVSWEPPWMKIYLESVAMILRDPEVCAPSWKILLYLERAVTWGNALPGPTETAEALSLDRSVVSRSYSELVKAEFLIKRRTRYFLSPAVGWKGTYDDYRLAYREMVAEPRMAAEQASYGKRLTLLEAERALQEAQR